MLFCRHIVEGLIKPTTTVRSPGQVAVLCSASPSPLSKKGNQLMRSFLEDVCWLSLITF